MMRLKLIKKQSKLKVNKVLEDIKEELNESRTMLGVQTMKDNPPFQTQKQLKEVGASVQLNKYVKAIDKDFDSLVNNVRELKNVVENKLEEKMGLVDEKHQSIEERLDVIEDKIERLTKVIGRLID